MYTIKWLHRKKDTIKVSFGGGRWIRTIEGDSQQIYSLPPLAAREFLHVWCWHQESNPGPTDYKSVALPAELYQHIKLLGYVVEEDGFEPSKAIANRFTVCPLWPLGNSSTYGAGTRNRTRDLLITSQLLYLLSYTSILSCFFNFRALTRISIQSYEINFKHKYCPLSQILWTLLHFSNFFSILNTCMILIYLNYIYKIFLLYLYSLLYYNSFYILYFYKMRGYICKNF